MINMHTKFEVSKFTHYKDMKGNAKCTNWGGLGCSGSSKVTGNVTIQYSATSYSILIETIHLSCIFFKL